MSRVRDSFISRSLVMSNDERKIKTQQNSCPSPPSQFLFFFFFCFTNCVYYATVMMILSVRNKNKLTDLSKPNAMSSQMFLYFQCDIRRGKNIFAIFKQQIVKITTIELALRQSTKFLELIETHLLNFFPFKYFDWNLSKEDEKKSLFSFVCVSWEFHSMKILCCLSVN